MHAKGRACNWEIVHVVMAVQVLCEEMHDIERLTWY